MTQTTTAVEEIQNNVEIPEWMDLDRAEKEKVYRDELLAKVVTGMEHLMVHGALLVKIYDKAGDQIPNGYSASLIDAFRRVAANTMLPGTYLSLAFDLNVFRTVSRYPIEEQRKIDNGQSVEVVVLKDGAPHDVRNIKPKDLTPLQKKTVFGPKSIRDKAAQLAYLDSLSNEGIIKKRNKVKLDKGVEIHKSRGGITLPAGFYTAKQLNGWLNMLGS